jgi:hypothetical protein
MRHGSLVSLGRHDPAPLSSPTRGEEVQRGDPRVNSRAEGSRPRDVQHEASRPAVTWITIGTKGAGRPTVIASARNLPAETVA